MIRVQGDLKHDQRGRMLIQRSDVENFSNSEKDKNIQALESQISPVQFSLKKLILRHRVIKLSTVETQNS